MEKETHPLIRRLDVLFWGSPKPSGRARRRDWARIVELVLSPFGLYYGVKNAVLELATIWRTIASRGDWFEVMQHAAVLTFFLAIVRASVDWFIQGCKTIQRIPAGDKPKPTSPPPRSWRRAPPVPPR
jgi:hypothetical protein